MDEVEGEGRGGSGGGRNRWQQVFQQQCGGRGWWGLEAAVHEREAAKVIALPSCMS